MSSKKRILIVGKVPPWQGGTAVHTWAAACAFASEGYSTHVVTLLPSPSSGLSSEFDADDWGKVKNVENLTVTYIESENRLVSTLIGDGAFSLLYGAVSKTLERDNFDAAIGWYFDPFALATAMACRHANVPFFLRHAGSDLFRLTQNENLSKSYSLAFSDCKGFLTNLNNSSNLDLIRRIKIPDDKLIHLGAYRLPKYFINGFPATKGCTKTNHYMSFLVYGKLSRYKGILELAQVVGNLNKSNIKSQLLYIAAGTDLARQEMEATITGYLPDSSHFQLKRTVAPWKIPGVIESVDFVCVLENHFPIAIHTPILLREGLASGKPLILSREIAEKSTLRNSLVDGRNCLIIENVQDIGPFSEKVKNLIESGKKRSSMGYLSKCLSGFIEEVLPEKNPIVDVIEARLNWS